MTCSACERRLENAVFALDGVGYVKADCHKGTLAVEFSNPCTVEEITASIIDFGYDVVNKRRNPLDGAAVLIIILALYMMASRTGLMSFVNNIPIISSGGEKIGYAALFAIGFMTSVHCVDMCCGLNLASSMQNIGGKSPLARSVSYNLGRLASYTLIGGILGLIGEKAAISLTARGVIGLIAGAVMLIMAINMLFGRKIGMKLFPKLSRKLAAAVASLGKYGPFAIGLANGLMPCGLLQSMQIYAISCWSIHSGALSMLFFALGTMPLVLLTGTAAGILKQKMKTAMLKIGSALLILMGLVMLHNNLVLTGIWSLSSASSSDSVIVSTVGGDVQYIKTSLHPNGYDDI